MVAAWLAHFERDPAEVERLASDLFELSTVRNLHLSCAEQPSFAVGRGVIQVKQPKASCGSRRIRDYRATGSILDMPFLTALRAETLYLADRTSDALEAIAEVEELIERFENRYWCAEIQRLRGVFLAALVPTRSRLRLHSAPQSESQRSRSRFR